MKNRVISIISACLILFGLAAPIALAADPPLERYDCVVMVMGAPGGGVVRVRLTIERWTTPEERKAYIDTVKSGGSAALAKAMEKAEVGYIQIDQSLRYPIAYAVKGRTSQQEIIRVATNRPIGFTEMTRGFQSLDYPIGVMELDFPPGKPATGWILGAAAVRFDKDGRLEVKSHPRNTGAQKITQVTKEEPKDKDKDEEKDQKTD